MTTILIYSQGGIILSYQPKSYRKFLAGSVSAAMVASTFAAVAPADVQQADAAESFSDVSSDYWASGSIQRLAEEGIINGYSDGTYGPGEEISRGQVAELLVNAFDLEVDQNAESSFEDLNDDSYSTPFAEAVAEAGYIKGRQDNTHFAAGMDLSRQQLATILVRAFELEPKEGAEANVADIDDVNESHKENVKILAQYDITNTSDGSFRPSETVNRAQFAVFLERAMEVSQGEESTDVANAEAVNRSTVEVSFNSNLEEDVSAEDFTFDPEIAVTEVETISPEESEASESAEGTVVRLTTEEQEAEESYSLSYKGEATGQTVTGVNAGVMVDDVSVLSTSSFEVNLDETLDEDLDESEVEELLDVSVTNNDDEETNVDITNLTISEDRESITVEHADNDLEGTAGTLHVNGFESDFDYEDIEVESVEGTTEQIRENEEQQLEFTVNGIRDLSVEQLEDAGYDVEFLYSSNEAPFDSDEAQDEGIINGEETDSSFRYAVSITDEDGNEVTSEEVSVDVNADSDVTEVTEVGLFDGDDRYENDYVTTANEGNTIEAVTGLNSFGEEVEADEEIESVTSSDVAVAYYNDGLQVNGEGEVTLSVKFKGIEDPVEMDLEVVEDQEISSVEENNTTQRYTTNAENDTFTVVDQYGEQWEEDEENPESIDYTITDEEGEVVQEDSATINDGTVNIDYPDNLEGEYELNFTYNDEDIASTTLEFVELDVTEVDEFNLSAEPESVDLADAHDDSNGDFYENHEDLEISVTSDAMFDGADLSEDEVEEALTSLNESGQLQVRTSDEDIATVADGEETDVSAAEALNFEVNGESEGTATVYLEHVEGDFTTTLAQVEVEVENTISQIENLELAEGVEALEIQNDGGWDVNQLSSSDADLQDYMIDNVDFSSNDGQAVITLKEIYGGETFVVDAEEA